MIEKLQMRLGKFASAMSANIYVNAIKEAMLAYVPFTFIASIFLILACFPSEGFNKFVSSVLHTDAAVWQGKLLYVYFASIAIGGLLVVITMSYSISEKMKLNQIQVVITALVSFLVLVPLGATKEGAPALALSAISAQSMFCAILVAIFTAVIYRFIDSKGIKIKMPASVPPAVSAPFEALIPSFLVICVFWVLRMGFDAFKTDAVGLINKVLGMPLTLVGGSVIGIMFIMAFQQLLWFFGLHGSSIVTGVMLPVWQVLEDKNKAASMAGLMPEHIISNSFYSHFASIGIQGAVIAAIIVARSKQYREVAKISTAPLIFNVGEPALFGFPMMLNFTLAIPLIFTSSIVALVSYIAFALKLVPIATGLVQLPWTTPIVLSGFLVTGSWKGAALQIVCIVISTLIWMPFMKKADRRTLAIENGQE
ncbi:PTS sugar transporter subunit IIC [Anaeromicropila herbilytica]|uniref:Permease IIC component n=1 Tax=Anaeromicropila herbilytica TaxID=2785025 RepID=A0A7R7EM61_9FIRM|nr:PTS transporter subunit EIIC [Anaeromicropila herbilytica]BCN31130.1 permease IIC component [Anaeromicropila herbilytica]